MPVDTRNKRASTTVPLPVVVPPAPDGALSAADRQQAAWCYSGIAATVPAAFQYLAPSGAVLREGGGSAATLSEGGGSTASLKRGGGSGAAFRP